MQPKLSLLLVAGACAALAGCDNGRASVLGTVTYQGRPVESGSISFEPIDGKGGTAGGAIEQGRFMLDGKTGVFPGKKRVNIIVVEKTGRQIPASPPSPPGTMVDEVKPIYSPPQEAEVVEGKANALNFQL